MEKIRVAVFGTGDYFNDKKAFFREDIVVIALLDNDSKKQGTFMDGIAVHAPEKIRQLEYDYVCLMSMYHLEMKQQLLAYGVPEEKIILYYEAGMLMQPSHDQYDEYNQIEQIKQIEQLEQIDKIEQIEQTKWNDGQKKHGRTLQQDVGEQCIQPAVSGRRNRILLCSWNLGYFGGNIALYDMASVLQELGHQVYVVSNKHGDLERDYQSLGIPVIVENYISGRNKEFMNLISRMDIVVVNTAWFAFIIDDLCRHVRKAVLWWIHDSRYVGCYRFNQGIKIEKHSNLHIYAVGLVARTDFLKAVSVDTEVKQLLYGIEDLSGIKAKPVQERDKIRIAVVGSIEWLKGQDIVIDAFCMLSDKERDQFELFIIGSGNGGFADKIRQRASGISQILCMPAMPHDKLMELYLEIDVIVSASRSDSMPIVITEGMMQSKICIIPDHVGTAAYIEDGINGLVFEQENARGLSEKLRWLLRHRDELAGIGQNARRVYETYFSKDVFADNIKKVMEKLEAD